MYSLKRDVHSGLQVIESVFAHFNQIDQQLKKVPGFAFITHFDLPLAALGSWLRCLM